MWNLFKKKNIQNAVSQMFVVTYSEFFLPFTSSSSMVVLALSMDSCKEQMREEKLPYGRKLI